VTGATPGLHPAQNRGLRELYSAVRQLAEHWTALADRLDGEPGTLELGAGADAARALLVELADVTASYGLYGGPAAQGVGSRAAGLRTAVLDRTLERNQALRRWPAPAATSPWPRRAGAGSGACGASRPGRARPRSSPGPIPTRRSRRWTAGRWGAPDTARR